jgi:hypothetical protein
VLTAGVAVAICVFAALAGKVMYGSGAAQTDQPKTDYAVSRDDHGSPIAHAVADLGRGSTTAPAVASTGNANVIRRPIISLEQYLAGVPKTGVKRWNVVMVQIESLRSDQLRSYGGTRDVMSTIDAIARIHQRVHPGEPFQLRGPRPAVIAISPPLAADVRVPAKPGLSAGPHI